jgi:hypothetical protein
MRKCFKKILFLFSFLQKHLLNRISNLFDKKYLTFSIKKQVIFKMNFFPFLQKNPTKTRIILKKILKV